MVCITGTKQAVLYCTVLYCTILNFTVVYCTVLYCTELYCTVLYWAVLYCRLSPKISLLSRPIRDGRERPNGYCHWNGLFLISENHMESKNEETIFPVVFFFFYLICYLLWYNLLSDEVSNSIIHLNQVKPNQYWIFFLKLAGYICSETKVFIDEFCVSVCSSHFLPTLLNGPVGTKLGVTICYTFQG